MFRALFSKKNTFVSEQIREWTGSDISHSAVEWFDDLSSNVMESNSRGVNIQTSHRWHGEGDGNVLVRQYEIIGISQGDLAEAWDAVFDKWGNKHYGYLQLFGDASMIWVDDKLGRKFAKRWAWFVKRFLGYRRTVVCSELVWYFLSELSELQPLFRNLDPERVEPDQLEAVMRCHPKYFKQIGEVT